MKADAMKNLLYIGYRYETMSGKMINKCVICENEDEYRKIRHKIDDCDGVELIEFIQIVKANQII